MLLLFSVGQAADRVHEAAIVAQLIIPCGFSPTAFDA
jgi:hypothetical protein